MHCRCTSLSLMLTVAIVGSVYKAQASPLLPEGWDPVKRGGAVLKGLVRVTLASVKGAHDSQFVCVGQKAYIVAEVSEKRAGEAPDWVEVYVSMSIVDLETLKVDHVIPVARGGEAFENAALPVGACFVPRILKINETTLRCYFASERPHKRQSVTWYRDFNISRGVFAPRIFKAKLKTSAGTFDMEPRHFHADAVAHGFKQPATDHGMYIFDSFKRFDGRTYVTLNNYQAKQNALAILRDDHATFEIVGHYNEPQSFGMSESAVNRLPDGTWMAICRNRKGTYLFTRSKDGRAWTVGEKKPFLFRSASSKPTFDKFGDVYYLGWQHMDRIDKAFRSVFIVDVSRDGKTWERKYRFESAKSFQYPTFHEHNGAIWLSVTQGDSHASRKERIMFGKLEDLADEVATPPAE